MTTEELVTDRDPAGTSWATFDPAREYRYALGRSFPATFRVVDLTCLFIMVNPSTADAMLDDSTIRRCKSFAQREGCDSLEVVNLYAWRSTDPSVLARVADPVGPCNDEIIQRAAARASIIIAAWGAPPSRLGDRHRLRCEYIIRIVCAGKDLWCLGRTQHGHPRHPLYLPAKAPLERL